MPDSHLYELHRYLKPDGSFDYEGYKYIQCCGNKRKLSHQWATKGNIRFLADYIAARNPDVRFGLCHGTRSGREQRWFRQFLNCDVIGTEISDTATRFPHTIQWDFHEVKPEWISSVDFIYSNSLDHSYDPAKCLRAWMSCLKPDGLCITEHGSTGEYALELDPFGVSVFVLPYLILKWGEGKFAAVDVLDAPEGKGIGYLKMLVIRRCE